MPGYFNRKRHSEMPDVSGIKRFYAEGGYVGGEKRADDDLALFASQNYAQGGVVHDILGTVGGTLGNLIPIPVLGPMIGSFLGKTAGNLIEGNPGNIDDDAMSYVPQHLRPAFGFAGGGKVDALLNLMRNVSAPVKAWHGTPHNVEKFDSSKIGTGEGAQVYGHGLYFAENPEVAKWYRETLSGEPKWYAPDQTKLDALSLDEMANSLALDFGIPDTYTTRYLLQNLAAGSSTDFIESLRYRNPDLVQYAESLQRTQPGNLYGVNLHVDPKKMLSLDEPLMMQGMPGKRTRDILEDMNGGAPFDDSRNLMYGRGSMPINPVATPEFAERIASEGIPGIRYLDGMSRSKGKGTENFVMFPGTDDLIEIIERHAQGGPVGYAGGGKVSALSKFLDTLTGLRDLPLAVAAPEAVLDKVAKDGRFKSQFETGTSRGLFDPEHRARVESELFGVPLDLDPALRPIYGHVALPMDHYSAIGYGNFDALLNPSVKERSTFNIGDSFGLGSTSHFTKGPYAYNDVSPTKYVEDLLSGALDKYDHRRLHHPDELPKSIDEIARAGGYVESQIHGGLPWGDVDALLFKPSLYETYPSQFDAFKRRADRWGRPVYAFDLEAVEGGAPRSYFRVTPGNSGVEEVAPSELGFAGGGLVSKGVDALENFLATLTDIRRKPIAIAVDEDVLPLVQNDGRFKSQFETSTSNGMLNPRARAMAEFEMFGTPLDIDPALRPIYGHVATETAPHHGRWYGNWNAMLDPLVKERATFTLGDSLDLKHETLGFETRGPYAFNEDYVTRQLLDLFNPDRVAYDMRHYNTYDVPVDEFRELRNRVGVRSRLPGREKSFTEYAADENRFPNYVEAQVHGGVNWDDVTNLVAKNTVGHQPDTKLFDYLLDRADRWEKPVAAQTMIDLAEKSNRWWRAMPGMSGVEEVSPRDIGFKDGGKVGSLFNFVKNLAGTTSDLNQRQFRNLQHATQRTGNEHSRLMMDNGDVSLVSKGNPTSVSLPEDYKNRLVGNPHAAATFAHTHPNDSMFPSPADFGAMTHDHPFFGTLAPPENWILGVDQNAALRIPRMAEQDFDRLLVRDKFFPMFNETLSRPGGFYPMFSQIDAVLEPYVKARKEATGGITTLEDVDALTRAQNVLAYAWPHNELLKSGMRMDVDPALTVLKPAFGEHATLTIGDLWPQVIDRMDTLGVAPFPTEAWRGYAGGGSVDDDMALFGVQNYAGGGEVARRSANALIDYLSRATKKPAEPKVFSDWHGVPVVKEPFLPSDTDPVDGVLSIDYDALRPRLPLVPDPPRDRAVFDAISDYMSSGYETQNKLLRRMAPGDTYEDILRDRQGHYKGIASNTWTRTNAWKIADFLDRMPNKPTEADLFRGTGITFDSAIAEDYLQGLLKGDGVGSFSYSPRTARTFSRGVNSAEKVPVIARLPKGSNVGHFDARGVEDGEWETLLAPKQGFRASDVYVPSDGNRVFMDITPAEYDYFAPPLYAEGGPVGYAGGGEIKKAATGVLDYLYKNLPAKEMSDWVSPPSYDDLLKRLGPAPDAPIELRRTISEYTGDDFSWMNLGARNKGKARDPYRDVYEHGLEDLDALEKWLASQTTEIPSDLFRGVAMLDPLRPETPRLRGDGFGSFSYDINDALNFSYPKEAHMKGGVPLVVRLPAGSKVSGADIRYYNENAELEHLLAPKQGFEITDMFQSPSLGRLLIDAVPTGYHPDAPALYARGGYFNRRKC